MGNQTTSLMANFARERTQFAEGSLRSLVQKWLWPTQTSSARVTRFGRTALARTRIVRLEVSRPERPIVLLFFRHADGTWNVFPQASHGPTMRIS